MKRLDGQDKSIALQDRKGKTNVKKVATRQGAMCSYCVFIVSCMIPYIIYKETDKDVISIVVLPGIVLAGAIAFFVARAITLLVLYGREARHGQE